MHQDYERLFLKEGYILGIQMLENSKRMNYYFRVLSLEDTPYQYSFAAIAAGGATGWIRPQDSSNRYFLNPPEQTLINHMFVGLNPTRLELYLQYPLDKDKGALVGSRVVGSGMGMFAEGITSPYRSPSTRTEIVSIKDIDPAFNAYSPIACTPKIYVYAVQYRVSAPLTTLAAEEKKRARIVGIFGKNLADAPNWLQNKGEEVKS